MSERDAAAVDPGDRDVGDDDVGAALAAAFEALERAMVGRVPGEPEPIAAVLALVQQLRNRADAVQVRVLAVAQAEKLHETLGYPSLQALLVARTRVSRSEANACVRRLAAVGPRATLTGEPLSPCRPVLAAAHAAGAVNAEQLDVIARGLVRLSASGKASPEQETAVESALVNLAANSVPTELAKAVRHALDRFDPDGPEPREKQARSRRLTLVQREDGTGELRGRLTPMVTAKLLALLDGLAAPRAADAHGPDPRHAGQRVHDALEDLVDRLLRAGDLPAHGGVPMTLIVTMDLDDLKARSGRALTGNGVDLDVATVLAEATEAEYVPVVLSKVDGIVAYGTTRRIASPGQSKALFARDRGCTFPDCTRPGQWTERHHILDALYEGPTDLDNLTLVCRWHHRHFQRLDWQVQMIDGRPWWIPPTHVDPDQTPRRNTYFDTPNLGDAA